MEHPDEHDALNEAPTLRGLSNHDPFVVPEQFFERFPHAVQQRISAESRTQRSWPGGLFRVPRLRVFFGSVALVAVVLAAWLVRPTSAPAPLAAVAVNIEPEEILHEDVDTEMLFTALDEEDGALNTLGLSADEDELLAYLENEDLPLELLIEDL